MHRTQDVYPLSHFRQNTKDHLERIAEGSIETITQNGKAAMVVMSPQTYDALALSLERGQAWDEAIEGIKQGRGKDARTAIKEVASELGLEL